MVKKSLLPLKNILIISRNILNIVFPKTCLACRAELFSAPAYLCKECAKELVFCHDQLADETYQQTIFLYEYTHAVREIIHGLKYFEKKKAARQLVKNAVKRYAHLPANTLIIPIPLHPVRLRTRGFNQAAIIAKTLAKETNLPLATNILKRLRHTQIQTHLNRAERLENVKNAFFVAAKHADKLADKHIVLVDDVYTTGATCFWAAAAFGNFAISDISIITLARAGESKNHESNT